MRMLCGISAPDLAAGRRIVVDEHDAAACFGCGCGGGDAGGAGANDEDITARHPVTTVMPWRAGTWHVRTCGMPLTVARHSMQMPMPHNGRTRLAGDGDAARLAGGEDGCGDACACAHADIAAVDGERDLVWCNWAF